MKKHSGHGDSGNSRPLKKTEREQGVTLYQDEAVFQQRPELSSGHGRLWALESKF